MKKIYLSIYKFHTEDDARERNMVEIWKMLVARQSHLLRTKQFKFVLRPFEVLFHLYGDVPN